MKTLSNNNWFKYLFLLMKFILSLLIDEKLSFALFLFSDFDAIIFLFKSTVQYSKSSWDNKGLNLIATFIVEVFVFILFEL